jgi:hypothetical protein
VTIASVTEVIEVIGYRRGHPCKWRRLDNLAGSPLTPHFLLMVKLAILCQHRVYTAGSHRIPYTVHARVLQGCLALPRVLCLFENLIAFSGGVRPQGFDLLREGDQTPCTTSSSPAGRYVPRSISSPCRVILNMKPRCWAPTVFLRCALVSSSGINAPTSSSHQIAAR